MNRYNLDNFEAIFREFLKSENISPVSLKNYLSDIRHFFGWFGLFVRSEDRSSNTTDKQNTIFSFLTKNAAEQYKTYLTSNNLPDKTVNRRLSTLRKFCSLAISQGWIQENVAKQVGNVGTPVITNASMSLRAKRSNPVEIAASSRPVGTPRNDMLSEFKQYMLSQQSNHADENVINHVSTKDTNLVLDDIKEFFTFINLPVIPTE